MVGAVEQRTDPFTRAGLKNCSVKWDGSAMQRSSTEQNMLLRRRETRVGRRDSSLKQPEKEDKTNDEADEVQRETWNENDSFVFLKEILEAWYPHDFWAW